MWVSSPGSQPRTRNLLIRPSSPQTYTLLSMMKVRPFRLLEYTHFVSSPPPVSPVVLRHFRVSQVSHTLPVTSNHSATVEDSGGPISTKDHPSVRRPVYPISRVKKSRSGVLRSMTGLYFERTPFLDVVSVLDIKVASGPSGPPF